MKNEFAFSSVIARAAMTLLLALLTSVQGAFAKDFISDVMVVGNNNKTAFIWSFRFLLTALF